MLPLELAYWCSCWSLLTDAPTGDYRCSRWSRFIDAPAGDYLLMLLLGTADAPDGVGLLMLPLETTFWCSRWTLLIDAPAGVCLLMLPLENTYWCSHWRLLMLPLEPRRMTTLCMSMKGYPLSSKPLQPMQPAPVLPQSLFFRSDLVLCWPFVLKRENQSICTETNLSN